MGSTSLIGQYTIVNCCCWLHFIKSNEHALVENDEHVDDNSLKQNLNSSKVEFPILNRIKSHTPISKSDRFASNNGPHKWGENWRLLSWTRAVYTSSTTMDAYGDKESMCSLSPPNIHTQWIELQSAESTVREKLKFNWIYTCSCCWLANPIKALKLRERRKSWILSKRTVDRQAVSHTQTIGNTY